MKDPKFRNRRKYLEELEKNIPFGHFCWGCRYRTIAGKYTDYLISEGKNIKLSLRKIKCKVIRTNSKNDMDFSEGLKCCELNVCTKEELKELEKIQEWIDFDSVHGDAN